METVIDTNDVAPAERLDYWQDAVSRAQFPFLAWTDLAAAFSARIRLIDVGGVQVAEQTSSRLRATRTARLIKASDPEVLQLDLITTGAVVHTQNGRTSNVGPGEFFLRDSSRPYVSRRACGTQGPHETAGVVSTSLVVQFPRTALSSATAERLTAGPLGAHHGLGALLSDFMSLLLRHSPDVPAANLRSLGQTVLDLTTSLCCSVTGTAELLSPESRQQVMLARIRQYINRNLTDPNLTPSSIAASHQISLRYLHRLFQLEGEPGVAATIRSLRLERCSHDLANPGYTALSVSTIAARWGLTDQSTFTRLFRTTYGMTPTAYRNAHTKHHGE